MSTPYTPAAISHIRRMTSLPAADIARALGWELETLQRIARKHGIELCGAEPTPISNGHHPTPVHRPPPGRSGPRPRPLTADMSLDEIALRLPRRQRQMLNVLRTSINGHFIHGREIAQRADDGMPRGAMSNSATSLKKRLEHTPWNIEVEFGLDGGYRLVTR